MIWCFAWRSIEVPFRAVTEDAGPTLDAVPGLAHPGDFIVSRPSRDCKARGDCLGLTTLDVQGALWAQGALTDVSPETTNQSVQGSATGP